MYEAQIAMGSELKIVASTRVGPLRVSTVFLCFDHSMFLLGDTDPVLWETMIFRDGFAIADWDDFRSMGVGPCEATYLGEEQWRYDSRSAAVGHHRKIVKMLRAALH